MGTTVHNTSEFGSGASRDTGAGLQGGARLGAIRPWFTLLLGITGGAVAIAMTLGLLVLLTSVAQAQPRAGAEQKRPDAFTTAITKFAPGAMIETNAADEKTDRIADDPSWQAPRLRQGILPTGAFSGESSGTEGAPGGGMFQAIAPEDEWAQEVADRDFDLEWSPAGIRN